LAHVFPDQQDFKHGFELSPILTAVLNQYDISDTERPGIDELISLVNTLSGLPHPVDWPPWKQEYRIRSPLFREIISYFQKCETAPISGAGKTHQLLEQRDAVQGWTPLQWAAFVGRQPELDTLLRNGAVSFGINSTDRNILHHDVESKTDTVLSYLPRH
jgi:hypothetical protein